MNLNHTAVGAYLRRHFGAPVAVLGLAPLGAAPTGVPNPEGPGRADQLKLQGYGRPVLVHFCLDGQEHRAVLRTMEANVFGHERRADRAAGMLLSYDTFNDLPQHVRALDVGVLAPDGQLVSVGAGEFFLLTDFAPGTLYADDLRRLRTLGLVKAGDRARARALATYLSALHAERRDEPALYRRHLRDVFGSGEGIAGICDSYPRAFALASPAWLEGVEERLVAWRYRLNQHPERLAQIHGDFHPFNVLFADGDTFTLLDRSRGPWGEPADDVTALAINYLFFSLQRSFTLAEPFTGLWDTFWQTYLSSTGDEAILRAVQPFFVWRALVVASPLWYQVDDEVRWRLFRFIDRILDEPVFDPARVTAYLDG